MNIAIRIASMFALLAALGACDKGDSFDDQMARANQFIASSEYESAVIELKSALLKDKRSAEARWLLGKVYLETGDALSAEKELQKAIDLGWEPSDVIPILAESLLAQGKNARIYQLSATGLNTETQVSLLAAKALAAINLGESQKAITLVDEALEKSPEATAALMAKSRILVSLGDFAGAELVLEQVIPQEPDSGSAWSLMGDIRVGQKNFEEALVAYDRAIAFQRNTHDSLFKRALLYLQFGNYEAAQTDAKKLLRIAPQDRGANYAQGLIYFQTGRYEEAIRPLLLAEPAFRRYPLVLFFLSSTQLIQDDLDNASAQAFRFHSLETESIRGRKLLSYIRLLQGRNEEAQDLLAPVLLSKPNDVGALQLMSNALLRDERVDQGITLLSRVAALRPDTSVVQITLGEGRVSGGQSDDATEYLETTLELGAEFQQADILGVMRNLQKQDYESAISTAQSYTLRNPTSSISLNLLGRVYQSAGQLDEARASFGKALRLDLGDPAANHSLAQLAILGEDLVTARRYYMTILEYHPGYFPALMQLAFLDDREGNKESYVERLRRAFRWRENAIEPRVLLARYHLEQGHPEKVALLFANLEEVQQQLPQVVQLKAQAKLAKEIRARDQAKFNKYASERQLIDYWVRELAPEYGLDPKLILAVIKTESNFNTGARSPANAVGLMQLIPATAARFGVRDRTDPIQNLHGGMAYLRWLLSFFEGDLRLSLAGYNAGEGAVVKYLGVPPYPETRNYVRKVLRGYGRSKHPPIEPVVKPTRFMSLIQAKR